MPLYGVIAAAGVAVIAATAWITAAEYKNLPERVPMQFWFDGKPTSFGPRPVVWLIVGVQLLCLAIFGFTQSGLSAAPATHRHVLGMDLFGLCIITMIANAQMMVIEAAKSLPDQRLPMPRYWISFIAFMVVAIACAVLF
jgi:Protein of unknown function (DUF1648)